MRVGCCSVYLSCDSEDPHLSKEFEELVQYGESENLYLMIFCDSKAHYTCIAWGSTSCDGKREALAEFLNSSNLKIINQGNEPTFCSGFRLDVIDITLGFFGLLGNIKT